MTEQATILDKAYDPTEAENRWYQEWQTAGVFSPDTSNGTETYVIMMPPPNVTGSLHMGHALTVTIQDMLIRYHRMLGKKALYLPGTDHAGIATQTVVERELQRTEQKTRHDLGRDAFLERVWAWKEKNGNTILKQLRTIGASADWDRLRFTMDDQCSQAVRKHLFACGTMTSFTGANGWSIGTQKLKRRCPTRKSNTKNTTGKCGDSRTP